MKIANKYGSTFLQYVDIDIKQGQNIKVGEISWEILFLLRAILSKSYSKMDFLSSKASV